MYHSTESDLEWRIHHTHTCVHVHYEIVAESFALPRAAGPRSPWRVLCFHSLFRSRISVPSPSFFSGLGTADSRSWEIKCGGFGLVRRETAQYRNAKQ
jgi:hypothetical protein